MAYSSLIENRVATLLTEVASCLCSSISDTEDVPDVCFCGLLPGAEVPGDYCDGGQAWARLVGISPYVSQGGEQQGGKPCQAGDFIVGVEIGILRCAPMPDDEGQAPSMAEQLDATLLQMKDMGVLRLVIGCCELSNDITVEPGDYTPIGPEGGCLGGTFTFTARMHA